MQEKGKCQKKRLVPPKKKEYASFRLFDFQTYDYRETKESDSGSGSGSSGGGTGTGNQNNKTRNNYDKTKQKINQPTFRMEMFGINEKGETAMIFVEDMRPFFFIKVGDDWTESTMHNAMQDLLKDARIAKSSIVSFQLVDYYKLYGFSSGKQSKFVEVVFYNMATLYKFKRLFQNQNEKKEKIDVIYKKTKLELYESKIPPLLRYFHIQNISPSGWIEIHSVPITMETTCDYVFSCKMNQILPLIHKETRVPFKICSFDIEASSSHGDFPVPIKNYKRLATQMVDVFLARTASGEIKTDSSEDPKVKTLFQNIIKKAFGLTKMPVAGIDPVFPKQKAKTVVGLEPIMKITEDLFSSPVEFVVQQPSENANIMTISKMFEKIVEESKAILGSNDAEGTDEGTGDADGTGEGATNFGYPKPKKVTVKAEKHATILDVLLDTTYTRDAKIQLVTKTLTHVYPALEGDKVTFIGSTFLHYGETEPYKNHCLVVGDCDPVENAEIVSVDSERELLTKWSALIQEENPDIIIGYNIFGFDYEFMFRRSQENKCDRIFLQLSRKMGEICSKRIMKSDDVGASEGGTDLELENTKTVLASGEYDLRYPNIFGRLQIDLLFYFRRDFNYASYKLDDVAGAIISDKIHRIEYVDSTNLIEGNTRLYSNNLTGLHVGDFIHIEIVTFTSDYFLDGKKFHVLDLYSGNDPETKGKEKYIEIAGHYPELDAGKMALKWCVSKDDVTPQDIFRLTNGTSADRAVVAKYCIQDCNLVQQLMLKTDVLTGYMEMARICNVPIRFLVFRGQGIKLTSYVAKVCREKGTLMPDLEPTENDDGYEGAIVLPPKCAMYMDNPVFCNDYSSLYPSIAKAWNLSPNSKVWTKDYDLAGELVADTGEKDPQTGEYIYDNLPEYKYVETEFDLFQTVVEDPTKKVSKKIKRKIGKRVCRWAQFPNGEEGIIPAIIGNLLKARSDTRIMAESEKDPFMANILDKRQLGYKVTANSLYGQMGSSVSTFFEKDVAASITAIGRKMIMYAKTMIEEIYGDSLYMTKDHGEVRTRASYVYGDTDSVFFTFNLEDPVTGEPIRGKKALEITIEIAQESAKICSIFLPPPMKLAYEKTMMSFILLSKKRYVGMLYENNANKGKLKFMGLSLKRRDACDYLKDIYGGVLTILMNEPNNIQAALVFLQSSLEDLIQGNVSMDKLAITKSLKSDYKNPKQIAHNVLAERIGEREPGNKPKPGDRIKYVYFVNTDKKALQGERIETPGYITTKKLVIDYNHYITNQLMKPLQQLFGLALEKIYTFLGKTKDRQQYFQEMDSLEKQFGDDVEIYMKHREKYCSERVKGVLFQPFLTKISNTRQGIQTIDSMFARLPMRPKSINKV
jgi:DNA polymerase elongation subunit (family B)